MLVALAFLGSATSRPAARVYAVGSDREAARLAGIEPDASSSACSWLMGALAGLAALLNAVRFSAVPGNAGVGLELKAIAAVVVGGTAISGGRGTLVGHARRRGPARHDRPGAVFLGHQAVLGEGDPGRHHPGRARARTRCSDGWRGMPSPSPAEPRPRRAAPLGERLFPNGEWVLLLVLVVECAVFGATGTQLPDAWPTRSRSRG